jgi:hypothetical protein
MLQVNLSKPAVLETHQKHEWRAIGQVGMVAIEDSSVARERTVGDMDCFDPLIYLRCSEIDEEHLRRLLLAQSSGAVTLCRLQSDSAAVTGLPFTVLAVHEVYQCAEFIGTGSENDTQQYKLRWMITGLRFEECTLAG